MKSHLEIILKSTKKMFETLDTLSENIELKFENLNDRLTAISKLQKLSDASCTSSLSDVRLDINALKADVDKKTNCILSKTQNLLDKAKASPDLAKNHTDNVQSARLAQDQSINSKNALQNQNHNIKTPVRILNPGPLQENSGKNTETPVKSQSKVEHKQRVKQDLTLITGSCILRGIETRFLDENVRVKHFKNAKIDDNKFELGKMDLSRYRNIVIHVGGHDIDAKCSLNIFKEKYQSLLN